MEKVGVREMGKGLWELRLVEVGLGIPEMGMEIRGGNRRNAGVFHRARYLGADGNLAHPFAKMPR